MTKRPLEEKSIVYCTWLHHVEGMTMPKRVQREKQNDEESDVQVILCVQFSHCKVKCAQSWFSAGGFKWIHTILLSFLACTPFLHMMKNDWTRHQNSGFASKIVLLA